VKNQEERLDQWPSKSFEIKLINHINIPFFGARGFGTFSIFSKSFFHNPNIN
jgi:hypothetical protein